MGDPRKLKRKFETPKKIWESERIAEEQHLLEEFGLKSMRELWVMKTELRKIRREARRLLSLGERGKIEGRVLLAKVRRLGMGSEKTTLEDLLSLDIKDILNRRLETMVVRKGLARTFAQGRQFITHGFISISGKRVSAPSYLVPVSEEGKVSYYKPIRLESPTPVMEGKSHKEEKAEG